MRARQTWIPAGIWLVLTAICLYLPGNLRFFALLPGFFMLMLPINTYQLLAQGFDSESEYHDEIYFEFGPSRLAIVGPDWRSETAWRRYRQVSEDTTHFHLFPNSDLPIMIPKEVFTPEAGEKFREFSKGKTGDFIRLNETLA
jgi:hypothetical protein